MGNEKSERNSQDSNDLRSAFKKSIKVVEEVLDGKRPASDVVGYAAKIIGDYAKVRANENHDWALALQEKKLKFLEKGKYLE